MPVAKLSQSFYEKFGDALTDELVNCLNTIESSYRLELRDLFDAQFGKFEAKMEQRFAEMELRFERRHAATDLKIEQLRSDSARDLVVAMRWHFAAWIPIALAVIGLYFKP